MENTLKVSVIIPTYNRAHLIGRAIESVLNQTFHDFELIVIDDGSIDDTYEVIKEFQKKDNRIIYLKHDKNKGASAARNSGINVSRGEYISFVDSDDEWLPEKLEIETKILDHDKNLIICSTGYKFINEKNGETIGTSKIQKKIVSGEIILRAICNTTINFTVVRKKAIEIGGFDEKLPSREDWDFWIRITSLGKGYQDSLNLVNNYTMRNDHVSSGISNKLNGTEALLKKHNHLFIEDLVAYSSILRNIAMMNLLNNDIVNAIKYYVEAYKVTNNFLTRYKILSIIIILNIFGNTGIRFITFLYKLRHPYSYLLW